MFKTIHFDKEDDLFVIPTIVISKIDTKYVKATNIHIAWLRYSLVFICKKAAATPKLFSSCLFSIFRFLSSVKILVIISTLTIITLSR